MKTTHFPRSLISKVIIGLLSLVLSACSSFYSPSKSSGNSSKKTSYKQAEAKNSAPKNGPEIREIRVAVPCDVPPINKPRWALDNISPSTDDLTFFAAALQELEQRKRYETQLERALDDCRNLGK